MQSGTFKVDEELSFHVVFRHDVASFCGFVVTRASDNDETCAPCEQLFQMGVDLFGAFDQTWRSFHCGTDAHDFQVCAKSHLLGW